MPDSKKLEEKLQDADPNREAREASERRAAEAPGPVPAPVKGMPVGEASDPSVLWLLAEAETARQNGNEERKNAYHDQIRELGYEVG